MKKAPTLNETLLLICTRLRAANPGWYFTISTAPGTRRKYARVHCLTMTSVAGTANKYITDRDGGPTGLALLRAVDRAVYDEMTGIGVANYAQIQECLHGHELYTKTRDLYLKHLKEKA